MTFICNLYTPAAVNLYDPVTLPFFRPAGSVTVPLTVVLPSMIQLAVWRLPGLSQKVPANGTVEPSLKEAPLTDLARAVELVAGGGTYVDPVLAGFLATAQATGKLPSLTQRERDVLRLLADGQTNEQIGRTLFISPETLRTHVRKAMDKLDADTRTQAVATALRQSLIA